MGLIDRIRGALMPERADWPVLTLSDYVAWIHGWGFPLTGNMTMPGAKQEVADGSFLSLVNLAYKSNGIVFACMLTRMQVFSQAHFQYQALRKGQPGALFGTPDLALLEHPWPGATTDDLLARMITYVDTAGNAYVARRRNVLRVMRPDWVTIVLGSPNDPNLDADDLDAELVGYLYHPGGRRDVRPVPLLPTEVAHFAPIPDPTAVYRGMSWLTPIVRDVAGDSAARDHKLAFFENGATPNLVVKRTDSVSSDTFKAWVKLMEEGHAGTANAYKTLYLDSGADATVVGKDLQQLEFKATQGAGETRIAAAAGVHPVIVGLSEGMQGSSLNAGNFNSARRLVADKTLWHLWGNCAGSLETIMPPPPGSRLWVDDKIPFLREDRKDAAEIEQIKAITIRQYTDAGFTAESAVAAVEAEDITLLQHSGLFSVQLQPPGTTAPQLADQAGRMLTELIAARMQRLALPPPEDADAVVSQQG